MAPKPSLSVEGPAIEGREIVAASMTPLNVEEPSPEHANVVEDQTQALSRATLIKLLCAGFSFFFAGTNDGSLGPLIPYILDAYGLTTSRLTIVYASSFSGWVFSALTNTHLTTYFNLSLGSMLVLGATLQLLSQLLRFWLPPYGLFCVSFFLTAAGQSYQDSYSNTYVAGVAKAHRWLGFIHGMYMLGCLTGPFIATLIATHSRWHYSYAVEVGLGVVNLAFVVLAFRGDIHLRGFSVDVQPRRRAEVVQESAVESRNSKALEEIKKTLRQPSVWWLSLFFFFFLGAGLTAGGWVVQYLVQVRHGKLSKMGYVPTGFYGGAFLGRLLLAEPTERLGLRVMTFIYILVCVAVQLIFWLVPDLVASVVTYCIMGFFSGPFFPLGISLGSKLFPKSTRSSALGFVFVVAQAGGALFPTVTGLVAQRSGVKVLQPILVGLLGGTAISWLLIPKVPKNTQ